MIMTIKNMRAKCGSGVTTLGSSHPAKCLTVGWSSFLQKNALESQIMEKKNQKRVEKQEFRSHFQEWCGDESNPSTGTLRSLAKGVTNGELMPRATYIRHSIFYPGSRTFHRLFSGNMSPAQSIRIAARARDSRAKMGNGRNRNLSKSAETCDF
jgi:hypothetical protein